MKTYILTIAYDGTDFCGWQRQKNAVTVQQTVEDALSRLVGENVCVTASGRTDEGVHALGQTVSFACDTSIPAENFAAALNCKLPASVRAISCKEVRGGFCARKSAKKKTYVYRFYLSDCVLPQFDRYAFRIDKPLNRDIIDKACTMVEGTHDFGSFYCLGSSANTTVRTVYSCKLDFFERCGMSPPVYELKICGNGFLYKMVRLIAGALLELNGGKITLEQFDKALAAKGNLRKIPAPGKGLTLMSVEYEENI